MKVSNELHIHLPRADRKVKLNLVRTHESKGLSMKGEIFKRTKHIVLNIDEHAVEIASEVLDDELAIEIAWEAINLVELYIILRIVEQMLLIAEYMLLELKLTLFTELNRDMVKVLS